MSGQYIEQLIKLIARFPSLGSRSARRIVLHLLKKKEILIPQLITALQDVYENIKVCEICGNYDTENPCSICRSAAISEIILALPATVDGQITMHYISSLLKDKNIKISSLAQGIPVGGELDYMDDGTIKLALDLRKQL